MLLVEPNLLASCRQVEATVHFSRMSQGQGYTNLWSLTTGKALTHKIDVVPDLGHLYTQMLSACAACSQSERIAFSFIWKEALVSLYYPPFAKVIALCCWTSPMNSRKSQYVSPEFSRALSSLFWVHCLPCHLMSTRMIIHGYLHRRYPPSYQVSHRELCP